MIAEIIYILWCIGLHMRYAIYGQNHDNGGYRIWYILADKVFSIEKTISN